MNYLRVIPRDLFNEADLLKCVGKLWIALDGSSGVEWSDPPDISSESGDGFLVRQDDSDGSIRVSNIELSIHGRLIGLYRPLNSRREMPLKAVLDDADEDVFNPDGSLTREFRRMVGLDDPSAANVESSTPPTPSPGDRDRAISAEPTPAARSRRARP